MSLLIILKITFVSLIGYAGYSFYSDPDECQLLQQQKPWEFKTDAFMVTHISFDNLQKVDFLKASPVCDLTLQGIEPKEVGYLEGYRLSKADLSICLRLVSSNEKILSLKRRSTLVCSIEVVPLKSLTSELKSYIAVKLNTLLPDIQRPFDERLKSFLAGRLDKESLSSLHLPSFDIWTSEGKKKLEIYTSKDVESGFIPHSVVREIIRLVGLVGYLGYSDKEKIEQLIGVSDSLRVLNLDSGETHISKIEKANWGNDFSDARCGNLGGGVSFSYTAPLPSSKKPTAPLRTMGILLPDNFKGDLLPIKDFKKIFQLVLAHRSVKTSANTSIDSANIIGDFSIVRLMTPIGVIYLAPKYEESSTSYEAYTYKNNKVEYLGVVASREDCP